MLTVRYIMVSMEGKDAKIPGKKKKKTHVKIQKALVL